MPTKIEVRERPIIFNGKMVRAILEGRKTQTRRVINPQPPQQATEVFYWDEPELPKDVKADIGCYFYVGDILNFNGKCPYGVVGDRLWVRETFWYCCEGCKVATYRADGEMDRADEIMIGGIVCKRPKFRWKPSIHMPKWAARLWLEITGIRVERVQDIDAVEAEAEGMRRPKRLCPDRHDEYILERFIRYWDSLNAKHGYGWDKNPWVWIIEFKSRMAGRLES